MPVSFASNGKSETEENLATDLPIGTAPKLAAEREKLGFPGLDTLVHGKQISARFFTYLRDSREFRELSR